MKRIYHALIVALVLSCHAFGADIESVAYNNLVASISRVQEPVVSGKYIIFTASGNARHTGIAFEHENYKKTWSFQRIVRRDELGKPQKAENGKLREQILFFIAEVPPGMREIRYRMVIDGLWTTDPLNAGTAYDYASGMTVSTIPVDYYEIFQTQNVNRGEVRFTYSGKPQSTIRLAGSFNNWDPFMYEMTEFREGQYELVLPLPAGTWYYAYYEGTTQLPDNTNAERVYTRDGRIASVVVIK